MPLMIMSPNIAQRNSPSSRKRSHDEYSEHYDSDGPVKAEPQHLVKMEPEDRGTAIPPHITMTPAQSPPAQSSPAALTDAGCSTPADGPASPSTPSRQPLLPVPSVNVPTSAQPSTMPPAGTALPTGQGPPKKRKRMTPAEKKAKEELDAARKVEKDKKTMEREAQKKLEEERRQQRVAEKQAAQAERAAEIEAKKKAKEERRLEHEKREREKKEEAEKKARAQTKIASFFGKKEVVTPKPSTVVTAAVKARSPSPAAAVQTEYAKLALPFFVHPTVTMAKSPFVADEETSTAKTKILTDYLEGRQPPMAVKPFDPLPSLRLGGMPSPRGRSFPCVRDLMADQDGGASNPIELIAKSLNLPTKQSLKLIPMKQLSFHEDVRPGYYGTVTAVQSVTTLRKMARNPAAKELPLNYDYDSEAEWVQGEEEEDEAIDDMTDDDDDEDDAKSLNEFLDDDDDMGRATGRLMVGNLEPESSGICFEDRKRANPNPQMYKFRMEFLIPDLDHHHSVDPFCTTYWPSNIKTAASTSPGQVKTKSGEKTVKSKASDQATNTAMPPPLAPVAKPAVAATASKVPDPVLDMVPAHQIEDFKAAVMQFKFLPKIALLPTLKKQFDRCTKDQIKATLEHVAEKHGRKDWELKQST